MALRSITEENYRTLESGSYLPIDNYELPLELLRKSTDYHALLVPLLGQHHPGGDGTWCGFTSCAMIYNFHVQAATTDPVKKYIRHSKGKTSQMDLRHGDGTSFANFTTISKGKSSFGIMCNYDLDSNFLWQYYGDDRVTKGEEIRKNPAELERLYAPIKECLKRNKPVLIYTRISGGPPYYQHIILITGYFYLFNKLWLLIADPAPIRGKAGNFLTVYKDRQYVNEWIPGCLEDEPDVDVIQIFGDASKDGINTDWDYARANLYLLQASAFFKEYRKNNIPSGSLIMDAAYQELKHGKYLISTDTLKVPEELIRSRNQGNVFYPFQNEKISSARPLYYFYQAETSGGGYYPVGLNQTLHGGLHLPVHSELSNAVKCAADGYIVAAKSAQISECLDRNIDKFLCNYTGFILIRHTIDIIKDDEIDTSQDPIPLYSLYMHLKPFFYKGNMDKRLVPSGIEWLKRMEDLSLFRTICIDPMDKDFGKIELTDEPKNEENLRSFDDGTVDKMVNAMNALKEDKIITFGKPIIKVQSGETIGYVRKRDDRGGFGGFLHWEFLCPGGGTTSFDRLMALDEEIKKAFKEKFEEISKKDNFLEMSDIKELFKSLSDDEKKHEVIKEINKLDNTILSVPEYKKQMKTFYDLPETYFIYSELANNKENDKNIGTLFRYPFRVKLQEDPNVENMSEALIEIAYLDEEGNVIDRKLLNDEDNPITLKELHDKGILLEVPVNTSKVEISCDECHLQEINDDLEKRKIAFFQDFIQFRFRNLPLEHINEWTPSGLKTLLQMLEKKIYNNIDVETYYKALLRLVWWNDSKNEIDENFFFPKGNETSLFGPGEDTMLPDNAQIRNINPITTLWMLKLLCQRKKIQIQTDYTAGELNDPVYFGVFPETGDTIVYGRSVKIIVIGENFFRDKKLQIVLENSTSSDSCSFGAVTYDKNSVYIIEKAVNVWGKGWEFKIKRGDFIITKPDNKVNTEIKPPYIEKMEMENVKQDKYKLKINFTDSQDSVNPKGPNEKELPEDCPSILTGFLLIEYTLGPTRSSRAPEDDDPGWVPYEFVIPINGTLENLPEKKKKEFFDMTISIDFHELFSCLSNFVFKKMDSMKMDSMKKDIYIRCSVCQVMEDWYHRNMTGNTNEGMISKDKIEMPRETLISRIPGFMPCIEYNGFDTMIQATISTRDKKNYVNLSIEMYGNIIQGKPKFKFGSSPGGNQLTEDLRSEGQYFRRHQAHVYFGLSGTDTRYYQKVKKFYIQFGLSKKQEEFPGAKVLIIDVDATTEIDAMAVILTDQYFKEITLSKLKDLKKKGILKTENVYFCVAAHVRLMPVNRVLQLSYREINTRGIESSDIPFPKWSYFNEYNDEGAMCSKTGQLFADLLLSNDQIDKLLAGTKFRFKLERSWEKYNNKIFGITLDSKYFTYLDDKADMKTYENIRKMDAFSQILDSEISSYE